MYWHMDGCMQEWTERWSCHKKDPIREVFIVLIVSSSGKVGVVGVNRWIDRLLDRLTSAYILMYIYICIYLRINVISNTIIVTLFVVIHTHTSIEYQCNL